jgi:hypothetical protein
MVNIKEILSNFAKQNDVKLEKNESNSITDYVSAAQDSIIQIKELFFSINKFVTMKINTCLVNDKLSKRYKSKKFKLPSTVLGLQIITRQYNVALDSIYNYLFTIISHEKFKQMYKLSDIVVKKETILVSFMDLNLEKINKDFNNFALVVNKLDLSS